MRMATQHAAPVPAPAAQRPVIQKKVQIGPVDDPLEREADRIAGAVVSDRPVGPVTGAPSATAQRKCAECEEEEEGMLQRKSAAGASAGHVPQEAAAAAAQAVAHGGTPLTAEQRAYFEPRFGRDFGDVRVHTDSDAARSAREVNARAFTVGQDIAFGAGQFVPGTPAGRRLIAHELAHVAQGTGGIPRRQPASNVVRRQPTQIDIVSAGFIGPTSTDQRRAAASCDIGCFFSSIGTLHVMPLFFHASRGQPLAGSAGADGIGTSLHFQHNGKLLFWPNPCRKCTTYKMIQVLNTNRPAASRGQNSYVDNAARNTPFYDDVYKSGTGLHAIPGGYPDAGMDIDTTRSIYDRPFRDASALASGTGSFWGSLLASIQGFYWNAEACVTCVKPGKDKVLGCATYGFRRDWDSATSNFGPVQTVGPGCLSTPSTHFVTTLQNDTSTSSYDFET